MKEAERVTPHHYISHLKMPSSLDKHLLYREGQEHSGSRLFMLETIREYGLERLTAHDELETARLAHAAIT